MSRACLTQSNTQFPRRLTRHMKSPADSRGFTLIELLVTLAVVVILSTIAVPGFQRVIASSRLAADHNEIVAGLVAARNEAVKRREDVTFTLARENDGWHYRLFAASSDTEPLLDRDMQNARFDVDTFQVTFDLLGQRTACTDPCQFRVEHGDAKTVFISPAGYIGDAAEESP